MSMIYIASQSRLNSLKNQSWYHQRFDGAPLYIGFIAEAETKKEGRKPVGTEANVRACFFAEGKGDWYLSMADIERGADVMTALVRKDPRISKKLLAAWRQDERAFQDFFDKFERINIKKLKDHSLVELYRHYYHLAINRLTSSAIIDHFALGTDVMLADLIRKEIGRIGKESDFTRVFSVLTSPIHQSFISEAEMQMIKIVIEVKKTDIKAAKNSIEKYQQKYFWIKNNYINAQVLTVKHF